MTVINESFEDLEEWPWPRAIIYDSGPIECEYTHDHTGRLTIQTPGGVTHPDFEG